MRLTRYRLIFFAIILSIAPAAAQAADADHDGMPDSWEIIYPCLNPAVPDATADPDLDGLDNLAEFIHLPSLNPCNHDSDADGADDFVEIAWGSHPLDPSITPSLAQVGPEIRITQNPTDSLRPYLAATGAELGLAWYDNVDGNLEIYFARLDPQGAKLGPDLRVTHAPYYSYRPRMIWTGTEFAIVWEDLRTGDYEIFFGRVDAAGAPAGAETRVSFAPGYSMYPSLAWTGSEFGAVWSDVRDGDVNEIYFARLDPAGSKLGADLRLTTSAGDSFKPKLAWTGSEFGALWSDLRDGNYEIYFTRIGPDGVKIGDDRRITANAGMSVYVGIDWDGAAFAAGWDDNSSGKWEIYSSRVGPEGNKLAPDTRVSFGGAAHGGPSIAVSSLGAGIVYNDARNGNEEMYFSWISPRGRRIGPELRLSRDPAVSSETALAWTGSEFAVAWQDNRDGQWEVYFTRVGNIDHDGDGLPDQDETSLHLTNPADWDSDDDGLADGREVLELGSDPLRSDSDADGLPDGLEANLYHTSPVDWDSDHDFLPDPFELDYFAATPPLDPLNPADGLADFDADGLENRHEFWNGTELWSADPIPDPFANPACYYWADGDGDGTPGPGDLAIVKQMVADGSPSYAKVLPRGIFDTQDLDKDGAPGPGDISLLQEMLSEIARPSGYPSSPIALELIEAPPGPIAVGDTAHVTVSVNNQSLATPNSGGFAVVFSIDPASTGSAVLLGGEGEDLGRPGPNRYDVSGPSALGGRANIVLKATAPGTIILHATIPACGTKPMGRWTDEIVLSSAVEVVVR